MFLNERKRDPDQNLQRISANRSSTNCGTETIPCVSWPLDERKDQYKFFWETAHLPIP